MSPAQGTVAWTPEDLVALQVLRPLLDTGGYLPWSSGAMRPSALVTICNEIVLGGRRRIVELGSGTSTLLLARLLREQGDGGRSTQSSTTKAGRRGSATASRAKGWSRSRGAAPPPSRRARRRRPRRRSGGAGSAGVRLDRTAADWFDAGTAPERRSGASEDGHSPIERPISSFMISFVPA
ncbi:MAG TPA: hypothetical protein VLK58_03435 [Conexibacter sp.]|nr:hypothetical protein [Conexibacter sp.]